MPAFPGQPLNIPAKTWNRVERMAGTPGGDIHAAPWQNPIPMRHVVRIKNSSGSDVARGEILSWDGVSFDYSDSADEYWHRPILTGKTPAFPDDHGKIAVALEPIAADSIGPAAIGGITPALVDVGDSDHHYAFLKNGSTSNLEASTSGHALILHVTGGSGPTMCLIQLGTPQLFWQYSLNENMGATTANRASADLLGMDGSDTGYDVVIRDPLVAFNDQTTGDEGFCKLVGSQFFAIQAPC